MFTPLPLLHSPLLISPIQPTPLINPNSIRVIPRLHRQLCRRIRPNARLAVEDNRDIPLFAGPGLREPKARLELVRRQEERVGLRG
jgi:hypothetical protein